MNELRGEYSSLSPTPAYASRQMGANHHDTRPQTQRTDQPEQNPQAAPPATAADAILNKV